MSFFENAHVPSREPGTDPTPTDIRARIDAEEGADQAPSRTALATAIPWWVAEKFHWKEAASGRMRLSPLPEFLSAVSEDAPKMVQYGVSQLRPEAGSTEGGIVDALRQELPKVLESFSALDDREQAALIRYLIDRATRTAVYAATIQYEIDSWVAKAARRGEDASEHNNFGQKESRRDSFAVIAAAYAELIRELLPNEQLNDESYAKTARRVIYQQADMHTRELLSPQDVQARDQQAIEAAVLASRPI